MNPRHCAACMLHAVLYERKTLQQASEHWLTPAMASHRALIYQLVHGSCVEYFKLQSCYAFHLKKPLKKKEALLHCFFLIGFHQLFFMDIAPYAVLNETVHALKSTRFRWATGLLNATLKQAMKNDLSIYTTTPEACLSHPQWLIDALQMQWPEHSESILSAQNQTPPLTLRMHNTSTKEYLKQLAKHGISATQCSFSSQGIRLEKSHTVTSLPEYEKGTWLVQDEAAQLVAPLLELEPHHVVLDACAAPGGKTTHILQLASPLSVTALDISEKRIERMKENLQRLHLHATLIAADANQATAWWDGQLFDRILVDAPCSGTGVIRRHPEIKLHRQPEDMDMFAQQQQRLLKNVWPLLKPKGILVYSTCSILKQENEHVMQHFCSTHADAHPVPIQVPWGHVRPIGIQCFPQPQGMDGFYYAKLQKQPDASVGTAS